VQHSNFAPETPSLDGPAFPAAKALFGEADLDSGEYGFFAINRANGQSQIKVVMPIFIMHRLYRLGQAYSLRHLRDLSSELKLVIPGKDALQLARKLRQLIELTNDNELREYVEELVDQIDSQELLTILSIAVSTGQYHDERK